MAKKVYAPVETLGESLSKEIKKIYVPMNSGLETLSKNIVKGYASVDGVSKQVFGGGSTGGTVHTSTGIEKILWFKVALHASPVTWLEYYKRANGLLYYFIVKDSSGYYKIITFTSYPNRNAMNLDMVYEGGETIHIGISTYTTIDGVIWIYDIRGFDEVIDMEYPNDFTPNCLLDNPAFSQMTALEILTYVIENMI